MSSFLKLGGVCILLGVDAGGLEATAVTIVRGA
jgi:hypothetical protein